MDNSELISSIIVDMRKRAKAARLFANISILLITIVVLIMIVFFYTTPSIIISQSIQSGGTATVTVNPTWLSEIIPSLAKVAAILLAVYLIQILVGFTRYQYKIADHLDIASFSIKLCQGSIEMLEKTMNSISLRHIEFGKMPQTVSDKGLDLVKEAIKKIPGK